TMHPGGPLRGLLLTEAELAAGERGPDQLLGNMPEPPGRVHRDAVGQHRSSPRKVLVRDLMPYREKQLARNRLSRPYPGQLILRPLLGEECRTQDCDPEARLRNSALD